MKNKSSKILKTIYEIEIGQLAIIVSSDTLPTKSNNLPCKSFHFKSFFCFSFAVETQKKDFSTKLTSFNNFLFH